MNKEILISIFNRFCASKNEDSRERLHTPFYIENTLIATDATKIICLNNAPIDLEFQKEELDKWISPIKRILQKDLSELICTEILVSDLHKKMIDAFPAAFIADKFEPCLICGGTGEKLCDHCNHTNECNSCKGSGGQYNTAYYFLTSEVGIRNYLLRSLVETCEILNIESIKYFQDEPTKPQYFILTKDLTIIIMPCLIQESKENLYTLDIGKLRGT